MSEVDHRLLGLQQWLAPQWPQKNIMIKPLAGDASFRRYFRVFCDDKTFVAMDAPPAKENILPFIAIADSFQNTGICFPTIIAKNIEQGFLLLTDFGDQQLLSLLSAESADKLYGNAITVLHRMQKNAHIKNYVLPKFDDVLYWREFDLLFDWYLPKQCEKKISAHDEKTLRNIYQQLMDSAYAQPQVFVHRDYHSRNLMLCHDGEIGVLDFQDAVQGPITYDLMSLLRDCYIAWPDSQVQNWAKQFYLQLIEDKRLSSTISFEQFFRWFDWMSLQRHIKCLGIFSRLFFRDHKSNYLNDIPRVLNYALMICDRYSELRALKSLLV